jgi:hypothetical protein
MKKNMQENFNLLEERVSDALSATDLEFIRRKLKKIKGNTICSGVGGSSVVSEFASKVLSEKNDIIAINSEPRDMLYRKLKKFRNILACSYSGSNYGVEVSFENKLKKYILTNNSDKIKKVTTLNYGNNLPKEKSFVSLASTVIPMTILLDYYLYNKKSNEDNIKIIKDLIINENNYLIDDTDCYEIISGYDTSTAAKFLESTMVESGIAIPIIHDKYSYCHGRTTISNQRKNALIYFNCNKELDKLLLDEVQPYYNNIIVLDSHSKDNVIKDYNFTLQALRLTKAIAEKKGMDLSGVDYSPLTSKVYKYHGEM